MVEQPPRKGADIVGKEKPVSVTKDLKPAQPTQPSDKLGKDVSSKVPSSALDLGVAGETMGYIKVRAPSMHAKALLESSHAELVTLWSFYMCLP